MLSKYFRTNDYDKYLMDRLETENSKINTTYTRITIYLGIISLLFINTQQIITDPPLNDSCLSFVFYIIFIIYCLVITSSIVFIFLSIWSRTLGHPPLLKDINNMFEAKKIFFKENNIKIKNSEIVEKIQKELRDNYIEIADHNFLINRQRSKYSYYSILLIFISCILFILNLLLYNQLPKKQYHDKIQKVNIENYNYSDERGKFMSNQKTNKQTDTKATKKTTAKTTTKEPKLNVQYIKENEETVKK